MSYTHTSQIVAASSAVRRLGLTHTRSDTTMTGGDNDRLDHSWKPSEHDMMGIEHAYLRTDRDSRLHLPGGSG